MSLSDLEVVKEKAEEAERVLSEFAEIVSGEKERISELLDKLVEGLRESIPAEVKPEEVEEVCAHITEAFEVFGKSVEKFINRHRVFLMKCGEAREKSLEEFSAISETISELKQKQQLLSSKFKEAWKIRVDLVEDFRKQLIDPIRDVLALVSACSELCKALDGYLVKIKGAYAEYSEEFVSIREGIEEGLRNLEKISGVLSRFLEFEIPLKKIQESLSALKSEFERVIAEHKGNFGKVKEACYAFEEERKKLMEKLEVAYYPLVEKGLKEWGEHLGGAIGEITECLRRINALMGILDSLRLKAETEKKPESLELEELASQLVKGLREEQEKILSRVKEIGEVAKNIPTLAEEADRTARSAGKVRELLDTVCEARASMHTAYMSGDFDIMRARLEELKRVREDYESSLKSLEERIEAFASRVEECRKMIDYVHVEGDKVLSDAEKFLSDFKGRLESSRLRERLLDVAGRRKELFGDLKKFLSSLEDLRDAISSAFDAYESNAVRMMDALVGSLRANLMELRSYAAYAEISKEVRELGTRLRRLEGAVTRIPEVEKLGKEIENLKSGIEEALSALGEQREKVKRVEEKLIALISSELIALKSGYDALKEEGERREQEVSELRAKLESEIGRLSKWVEENKRSLEELRNRLDSIGEQVGQVLTLRRELEEATRRFNEISARIDEVEFKIAENIEKSLSEVAEDLRKLREEGARREGEISALREMLGELGKEIKKERLYFR